jgi:F-type H+-transporting ATPase subunit b
MPQFDFATFPSQIFWLIVCFGALYILLTRTALPKIGAVLEARQRKIDDDLERATELEMQAKEAMAAYEAELDAAREQAAKPATRWRPRRKGSNKRWRPS